jgi:hypothetical protein
MDREKFVALVNALLTQDHGVTEEAFFALLECAEGLADTINAHTEATDSFFYFDEGFTLSA